MIIIILTATEPYKPRYAPDIFYAAAEKLNISPELCLVFEEGDQGLEAATKSWNADCWCERVYLIKFKIVKTVTKIFPFYINPGINPGENNKTTTISTVLTVYNRHLIIELQGKKCRSVTVSLRQAQTHIERYSSI